MAITLEAPATVHVGDAIRGAVRGNERARVFVRRTTIWRSASGHADLPAHRDHDGVVVSGGAPFVLPALRGPLTYRGERAELRWSVVAESLDGPHERAEAPFVLSAPRATTYEREGVGGYRDRPTETTTLEPDFGEKHVEGPRRAEAAEDPFTVLGTYVARLFAAMTSGDRAGVSDVTLEVVPSRVRAGDELVAKLAFVTHDEIVVETITIQLAAHERWQMTQQYDPFIESRVETISERARLSPGPHTYEARLRVPSDATASFATADLGVEWFVRATIQVDGLPDAVSDFVIGVAPF